MSFRFETHLNVPLKSRMKKLSLEQAAKYGILHDLADSKRHIKSVTQDGDEVVILKQIDTERGWCYDTFGSSKKGWYERVTINRKEQTVAIDEYERHWTAKDGPYVWKRDLFMQRSDDSDRLTFVRHYYWINQLARFYHQSLFALTSMRLKSRVSKY